MHDQRFQKIHTEPTEQSTSYEAAIDKLAARLVSIRFDFSFPCPQTSTVKVTREAGSKVGSNFYPKVTLRTLRI